MAKGGHKAAVYISGTATAFSQESTSTTDDQTYQIDDTSKRVWDRDGAVTVERDDGGGFNTIASSEYTINRLTGEVTFNSVQDAGDVVRVSGNYLPISKVAEAKGFTWTMSGNNADSTPLDVDYMEREQTRLDVAGSLSTFWADSDLTTMLRSESDIVIEFYYDTSADVRVRCNFESDEISGDPSSLVEGSIGFVGAADKDGRAAARVS